jgi:hypothetical protein
MGKAMLDSDKDKRLGELLRLKRLEVPSESEWLKFDCSFENRRLSAIGDSGAKKAFSLLSVALNLKRVVCVSALFALSAAVSVVGIRDRAAVGAAKVAREVGLEYVKFASDDMFAHSGVTDPNSGINSMCYSHDGVEYIRDVLTLRKNQTFLAKM